MTELLQEHKDDLKDVIARMRGRIEQELNYRLRDVHGLEDRDTVPDHLDDGDREVRVELVEAIEREALDGHDWAKALDLYVKGAGYTLINQLAALRCMEVRGFIDRAVTRFRDDGCTPAADPWIEDEFYTREEGVFTAFEDVCDELAGEIEILFDRTGPYGILRPTLDAFEELCRMLDEVPDEAWQADDVLGWVYEFFNKPQLEAMDRNNPKDTDEVCVSNQFYTPHWVVRALTDNSLGKLYLERKSAFEDTLDAQSGLTDEDRRERAADAAAAPTLTELCTYLVPGTEPGDSTAFDGPEDIRVIDPACGSGHFLLYAFDVMERIWWAERPETPRSEVPALILRHNIYGVDLDMRACQLAAFNLYLKARARAEAEGADTFVLPPLNIVCADARIADAEHAEEVFDEVAGDRPEIREALDALVQAFHGIHGLGSLLNVRKTLRRLFQDGQRSILDSWTGDQSEAAFLKRLRDAVAERRENESFMAKDLRSFLKLLIVLSEDYDVALMNPPYGSRGRMPKDVKKYVGANYDYPTEYYINFFEVCERLLKPDGRVGMLVPRSFMFKDTYRAFREDFIGERGRFEFLAETGKGVLEDATVRTAITVVRKSSGVTSQETGIFIRLHDFEKRPEKKNEIFSLALSGQHETEGAQRWYAVPLEDFAIVPGSNLSYWAPRQLRGLYNAKTVLDAENGKVDDCSSLGVAKVGLQSGDDSRFYHNFWETPDDPEAWVPIAKGGEDAWMLPRVTLTVDWEHQGRDLKRFSGSYVRNEEHYFQEALTYTVAKEGGRRFGFLHGASVFGHKGSVFIPERRPWTALSFANSSLAHYLMLCQTPERMWEVGEISKLPWHEAIEETDSLADYSKEVAGLVLSLRRNQFRSPYYQGPAALAALGVEEPLGFYGEHPHRSLLADLPLASPAVADPTASLNELCSTYTAFKHEVEQRAEDVAGMIDTTVFDVLEVGESDRAEVFKEIALRHEGRNPGEEQPEDDVEPELDVAAIVRQLILHFALRILEGDDDGIVLLTNESEKEEPSLYSRVVGEFQRIWGEHADDRLAEADEALGSKRVAGEPYPNLREWLEKKLFEFHVSEFENTPILWKLTTERLVPNPRSEGFACLVDYHKLSAAVFDRIKAKYLEPRKAALRDKRRAANQRRSDPNLSGSEQAAAADELERCDDALHQVERFEEVLKDLSREVPREKPDEEHRALASQMAPKAAAFRARVEERVTTLDALVKEAGESWVKDRFSPTFLEKVQESGDEWIDALRDLEAACDAYAEDLTTPVEAHLYDLFPYVGQKKGNQVVGSVSANSGGFFRMHYYLKKAENQKLVEQGLPKEGADPKLNLLAEMASETARDHELGTALQTECRRLAKAIPSDWKQRALEEVTVAGYRPNKKHGVSINIEPLADAKIVPKTVDTKVLKRS